MLTQLTSNDIQVIMTKWLGCFKLWSECLSSEFLPVTTFDSYVVIHFIDILCICLCYYFYHLNYLITVTFISVLILAINPGYYLHIILADIPVLIIFSLILVIINPGQYLWLLSLIDPGY